MPRPYDKGSDLEQLLVGINQAMPMLLEAVKFRKQMQMRRGENKEQSRQFNVSAGQRSRENDLAETRYSDAKREKTFADLMAAEATNTEARNMGAARIKAGEMKTAPGTTSFMQNYEKTMGADEGYVAKTKLEQALSPQEIIDVLSGGADRISKKKAFDLQLSKYEESKKKAGKTPVDPVFDDKMKQFYMAKRNLMTKIDPTSGKDEDDRTTYTDEKATEIALDVAGFTDEEIQRLAGTDKSTGNMVNRDKAMYGTQKTAFMPAGGFGSEPIPMSAPAPFNPAGTGLPQQTTQPAPVEATAAGAVNPESLAQELQATADKYPNFDWQSALKDIENNEGPEVAAQVRKLLGK